MPLDPNTLKRHQKKLYDFISPVQASQEVRSGTPERRNMSKADVEAFEKSQDLADKTKGVNNALFTKLTGMSHVGLHRMWLTNKTFTTCNSFVGTCAQAMGFKSFYLDEQSKKQAANMGQFEIATWLAAHGLARAWVPMTRNGRPNYGDIFRAEEYHMGVSLDFGDETVDGQDWNTIEAGQAGPSQGYDMLKRKTQTWGERKLLGWVDMEKLLGDADPLPGWLGGWWEVDENVYETYYYYFGTNNECFYITRKPLSPLAPPPPDAERGRYTLLKTKYRTIEINWRTSDPADTLTFVETEGKMRRDGKRAPSTFAVVGKTARGAPLEGVRLAGPESTGLSYAETHPHGGAGDSTARR